MCPHHWSIHDPLLCIWSFLITVSSVHWTSLVAQMVKNPPANSGNPGLDPWVRKILWRRKWQPTPVFLPGEFHEQRSLTGHSPWSHRVRHDWATNRLNRDWAISRCLLLCFNFTCRFHTQGWTSQHQMAGSSESHSWTAGPSTPRSCLFLLYVSQLWHSEVLPFFWESPLCTLNTKAVLW